MKSAINPDELAGILARTRRTHFFIGIDPGKHTAIAVWDSHEDKFISIDTKLLHQAMEIVKEYNTKYPGDVFVIYEDARQRKWYGNNERKVKAKIKGAGSIERDSTIWEDFLTDLKIPFRAVPPRAGMTKVDERYFRAISKWDKRTSEHARDAAMLVLGK